MKCFLSKKDCVICNNSRNCEVFKLLSYLLASRGFRFEDWLGKQKVPRLFGLRLDFGRDDEWRKSLKNK